MQTSLFPWPCVMVETQEIGIECSTKETAMEREPQICGDFLVKMLSTQESPRSRLVMRMMVLIRAVTSMMANGIILPILSREAS